MKKTLFFIALIFSISNLAFGQSLRDTKDFIKENVDNNEPLENYDNAMFFNDNIVKSDADRLAGKTLSYDEFENIIIYVRDVFMNGRSGWLWTVAETADIRDIDKVSIQKSENNGKNAYFINVYLKGNYQKNLFDHIKTKSEPQNKFLEKMRIIIGDDYQSAQKIKKAIIHLGELKGTTVRDGDLF